MATMLHGESRRMYSWWWDSHISPKNSKWLQENLTDMDRNVKAMIKLIEEDADSFARRAEMYYKKRPELMKLVEEFYRAYRALAERYDHATGALRQAHRTMTEAFPNQIPPIMTDESPSASDIKIGLHTPEMPAPMRAPLDLDDLHNDALIGSSHFHARRRNGVYSEEGDLLSSKKGLKQLKELFPSGEGLARAKFSEAKVRKVLNFKEGEGRVEEKEGLKNEITRLQEEVSHLSTRNETLMNKITLESRRARTLEETILKLESMKDTALFQYKLSVERISSLETNMSNTRRELNKVNDEMVMKLNNVEEQCLAMEKVNKSVQLELETQQKELENRRRELEELNTSMEEEHQKRMQAEVALMSLEQIHAHSQEEAKLLVLEVQHGTEKLKAMKLSKGGLEEKISQLKEIIHNLHEQNLSFDLKIKDLQDEMKLLKETKEELEYELGIYSKENKALQKELCCLKEDQKDLVQRHQGLTDQMDVVSEKNVVLENSLLDANVELEGLREKTNALEASCEALLGEVSTHVVEKGALEASCEALLGEVSTHVVEKGVLVSQIEIISQNMERLSDKNNLLENSLSDANAELEGLRESFKDLEECCMSLCDQKSTLIAEKNSLVSQVENLESKIFQLQDQHLNLQREKDSTVRQVMELQSSFTLEKQEHEGLIMSLSSQLASSNNQICFLEEEIQVKVEDFEMEQQKFLNSLFEIFILRRCLSEMSEKNLFLYRECQNITDASRCAENQISQLKHKDLIQKKDLTSLSERNEVLSKGIHLLAEALSIDVKHRTEDDITDEVLVRTILNEIKNLINSISAAQDENRVLHVEVVNLESNYSMLQDHHANLKREKDSTLHQVMELESSLRLQKQEHKALSLSSSSQLASLQRQIQLLQEEIRIRDEHFEVEQQKTISAHLENFVSQRCLCDMTDKILILSGECQNLLEALTCSKEQISHLEQKDLIQKRELTLLSNKHEILRARVHLIFGALNIDIHNATMDDPKDEVLVQAILGKIRNLLSSISVANDENLCLHIEVSVLVTLFKQCGLDKFYLQDELESRTKELLALRGEKHELMEMTEKLTIEKDKLVSQVVKLETKYLMLQDWNTNLGRENDSRLQQVMELESSLRLQKQEHEALTVSSSSQLASLQNQIHLLQEEIRVQDEDFEVEQQNTISAHLENFVSRRCLLDMKDKILVLSGDCQNLLEELRCSKEQISQLEQKDLIQNKELKLLTNQGEILRARVHLILEALNIDVKNGTMDDPTDELLVQAVLGKIRNLVSSISGANDENQRLQIEVLVLVTLFKQCGLDKSHLHDELESRTKELLALACEKHRLMEITEQLTIEKDDLVSQVESSRQSLEILEKKYSELEDKNFNIEWEKETAFHQVLELERSLQLEKQERHAIVLSNKSQLASFETQLNLRQEEIRAKEDEFEMEQQKVMNALLENFILQRCLYDMKDRNSILSGVCQKLLEESEELGKLISELKHERLIQEKEMMLISENNEKLRSEILLLVKELNINKEWGTNDGMKDEEILQTLQGKIKTMLNSISNAQEESQCFHLEILVLVTLLKHSGLEKVCLYHELARQNEEVLFLQHKKDEAVQIHEQLKAEMQILGEQLSDLHVAHQRSQTEICNVLEENHSLSKRVYDMEEKIDALEGENNNFLAEALTLDHLLIFFKSLSTNRGLELKLFSDNICSILTVKDGLNEEIRVQNERMRELEVENLKLKELAVLKECDLNMARNFCEELYIQSEEIENLLVQKQIQASEAQKENAELCRKLDGVNKDLDGAKVMIPELEKEIRTLSAGSACKDEEITGVLETNRLLCEKLERLNCEVEVLRRKDAYLSSELQKESSEVYKCEGDIQTLLNGIQISTVNAAIFEEKVFELLVACERREILSMLQKEMFSEEIALKNACVDELKKKIEDLKGENGMLKADLNSYSPLLMSLFDGVTCLEEHISSLAKLQERRDDGPLDTLQNKKGSHQSSENDSTIEKAGVFDLQKLIAKVEALRKVTIIDTKNLLEQERLDSNASIEAARKEIEKLKLNEILLQEISKEKYGQTVKDIQLDQVSSSCVTSYRVNKNENAESDDQMLELWETAERDDIEAVEEVKSEYPSSELTAEKELSIDKLEVSTRVKESPREWNERFIKKLDSDSQRLSVVQRSLQELKSKLESLEKKKHPKTSEYGTLKVQLRETEEAISEQVDIICKLKKKVVDSFESSSALIWEKERRQMLEQERGGSEKIGKLELELQKIEYIFLKVEEEEENKKIGCVDRKSSILLREYIYGKRSVKGKRKGSFCGCMRPKTKG